MQANQLGSTLGRSMYNRKPTVTVYIGLAAQVTLEPGSTLRFCAWC